MNHKIYFQSISPLVYLNNEGKLLFIGLVTGLFNIEKGCATLLLETLLNNNQKGYIVIDTSESHCQKLMNIFNFAMTHCPIICKKEYTKESKGFYY